MVKFNFTARLLVPLVILALTNVAQAQRQMEKLGRGLVAVRSGNSSAYIGWRLLATDPESIGFNIYRSQNGAAAVKLNSQPITNTTGFVDATAALSVSNAWFVRPISNGMELAASAPFGIAANAMYPSISKTELALMCGYPFSRFRTRVTSRTMSGPATSTAMGNLILWHRACPTLAAFPMWMPIGVMGCSFGG
jgi:hypothetical protein